MKNITSNYFKKTIYLIYYLREMNFHDFIKYLTYASEQTRRTKFNICLDTIRSVYKYNIGIMDYMIFRFFEKTHNERSNWVGTGYKYEFDLYANPKDCRKILSNKILFLKTYDKFITRTYCTLDDIVLKNDKSSKVIHNQNGKIVLKNSDGQCGREIEVIKSTKYTIEDLTKYMKLKKYDLIEEYITQHPDLQRLSPSGLNTVRVITMINKNSEVDILGARLRISVNNYVDNLASGNIACPIDINTGIINGLGVYSDPTKHSVEFHPVTNVKLIGFQLPMWEKILELVKQTALHRPENKGIGWDIAITPEGPEVIEGNHNWCKILWQLPVNTGLKSKLEEYYHI